MTVLFGEHFFLGKHFPFHIDRYTIRPDEHIAPHTHDFIELVFVVSGSAVHHMSGHRYQLKAGDVFVLEPNVYHSYRGDSTTEAVVYNVLFDPGLLRKELDALMQMSSFIHFFYFLPFMRRSASFIQYQPLQPDEKATIEAHLETIWGEYMGKREGYQLLIKTRWIECLVWLSRYMKADMHAEETSVSDREWIDSVRHFIEQHYQQNLTLTQISRISGMSVSAFTAKFKSATGSSLLDYKHEIQIRNACELLSDTNHKVLDVGHEVGFNDISFFNKIFRKHRGLTPREYRQKRLKGN
ncbi:HTH-type transcriptional activator Btr [compost metagenome]